MTAAPTVVRVIRRTLDVMLVGLVGVVVSTIVVARLLPAVAGGVTLVVTGNSMTPAIPAGAAVLSVPVAPEALVPGDVVSVRAGERQAIFTHRVNRLVPRSDGLWIETKGDANVTPDPAILPASAVFGRVAWTLPLLGYLITLLSSTEGLVLLLGLVGTLLAAVWLMESLETEPQYVERDRSARGVLRTPNGEALVRRGGPRDRRPSGRPVTR